MPLSYKSALGMASMASILVALWYRKGLKRALSMQKANDGMRSGSLPSVSLVVACRNDTYNVAKNLPSWIAQTHPYMEIILVDDRSSAENQLELREVVSSNRKVSSIPISLLEIALSPNEDSKRSGKKGALTLGVANARNEVILLTDADCSAGTHWAEYMARPFLRDDVQVNLGYSPYHSTQGLVSKITHFETSLTAMTYISAHSHGWPYMGVGRNMAIRKSYFTKVGGYGKHYALSSGDDDLWVGRYSRPDNTTLTLQPNSWTQSQPETTISSWLKQKRRHLGVGNFYPTPVKVKLGMIMLAQGAIFPILGYGLIQGKTRGQASKVAIALCLMEGALMSKPLTLLGKPSLKYLWFPSSALYTLAYLPLMGMLARKPAKTW